MLKTKTQWRIAMVKGWLAWQVLKHLPQRVNPLWLVSHAGFYLHDPGYKEYVRLAEKYHDDW